MMEIESKVLSLSVGIMDGAKVEGQAEMLAYACENADIPTIGDTPRDHLIWSL